MGDGLMRTAAGLLAAAQTRYDEGRAGEQESVKVREWREMVAPAYWYFKQNYDSPTHWRILFGGNLVGYDGINLPGARPAIDYSLFWDEERISTAVSTLWHEPTHDSAFRHTNRIEPIEGDEHPGIVRDFGDAITDVVGDAAATLIATHSVGTYQCCSPSGVFQVRTRWDELRCTCASYAWRPY
jgi:hypothetical protein